MNANVEPQFTADHCGKDVPRGQIFGGVNRQFALGGAGKTMPEQENPR